MKKVAMFVFNGSPICFVHVLLNALDMSSRGDEVKIVMEGGATKLVPKLANPGHHLHPLGIGSERIVLGQRLGIQIVVVHVLARLDRLGALVFEPALDVGSAEADVAPDLVAGRPGAAIAPGVDRPHRHSEPLGDLLHGEETLSLAACHEHGRRLRWSCAAGHGIDRTTAL